MKKLVSKVLVLLGMFVGSIAFIMAQGSFFFWKQPRVPKHLKQVKNYYNDDINS